MNAHAVSTQVLSGTFKHGAGRIILLALGGTVVAAAVVTAVAVRQSSGSESPSGVSAQMNSALFPASREGVRGHVDVDTPFVAASESARSTSRLPNYPASREGVRGHVDVDTPFVAARKVPGPRAACPTTRSAAKASAVTLLPIEPSLAPGRTRAASQAG